MKVLPTIAGLLLCAAGAAQAAEPMNILGLPLGAKLKTPIRRCSADELKADVKSLCWVRPPEQFNGGRRSGTAGVPGADRRPAWAAQKTLGISVERDGTLSSFTIQTARPEAYADILNSITASLGRPQRESRPGAPISSAEWNWKDAHVELTCDADTGCKTDFALADRGEPTQRGLEARYNVDPIQPASPKNR